MCRDALSISIGVIGVGIFWMTARRECLSRSIV
jgi:hypothetical protein